MESRDEQVMAFGQSCVCPESHKAPTGLLLGKNKQTGASTDKYRSVLDDKMRPNSLIETFAVYLKVSVGDALTPRT